MNHLGCITGVDLLFDLHEYEEATYELNCDIYNYDTHRRPMWWRLAGKTYDPTKDTEIFKHGIYTYYRTEAKQIYKVWKNKHDVYDCMLITTKEFHFERKAANHARCAAAKSN